MNAVANPEPVRLAPWLERVWLERYLERRLDADETRWFELYLHGHPELLAEVEADLELRDALAASDPAEFADGSTAAWRNRFRPAAGWARAAGFVFAALLGAGGFAWYTREQAAVLADPTRLVFDVARGMVERPLVFHPQSNNPYWLIEVGVPVDAEAIVLSDAHGRSQALKVNSEGFVSALIERRHARAGSPWTLRYQSGGAPYARTLDLSALPDSRRSP